jgi:hypothetical protein
MVYRKTDSGNAIKDRQAERDVEQFRNDFGDDFIDPTTGPNSPRPRTPRIDTSLEARHRNGRCINCDD